MKKYNNDTRTATGVHPVKTNDGLFGFYGCPKCGNKLCFIYDENKPSRCAVCGSEFVWEDIKKKQMPEWVIPVCWEVSSTVKIKANTLAEAMEIATDKDEELPFPTDSDYIDGSWELSYETEDEIRKLYNNNQKDISDEYQTLLDKAYEAYKYYWCLARGYDLEKVEKACAEDTEYNGSMFACKAEFEDNEFYCVDFIEAILEKDDFETYKKYICEEESI